MKQEQTVTLVDRKQLVRDFVTGNYTVKDLATMYKTDYNYMFRLLNCIFKREYIRK